MDGLDFSPCPFEEHFYRTQIITVPANVNFLGSKKPKPIGKIFAMVPDAHDSQTKLGYCTALLKARRFERVSGNARNG